MKWSYHAAKAAARTISTQATLTDQSAANETDRNVIVHRFLTTGQAPGSFNPPTYGDLAELPEDLRGYINLAKRLANARNELPKQLHGMPIEELLALQPQQLKDILSPPVKPPDNQRNNNAHNGDQRSDAGVLPGTDRRTPNPGRSGEPGAVNQQPSRRTPE